MYVFIDRERLAPPGREEQDIQHGAHYYGKDQRSLRAEGGARQVSARGEDVREN